MALPPFLKRKDRSPSAAIADSLGEESGPTQQARVRARRRLIGAVVLLAAGVLVFPALFETRPRPLPADIPIEMPARDGAPARGAALPQHAPAVTALPRAAEPVPPLPAASARGPAGTEEPASHASAPAPAKAGATEKIEKVQQRMPHMVPDAAPGTTPGPAAEKAAESAPPVARRAPEAERVRELLEGRAAASAPGPSGRFIVQVGAFRDEVVLRDVRSKVEKLGLRTYTQVIETNDGRRTRVRVGPFASRQEADGAGAKLKAAGLPAHVLTL